MDPAYLSRHLSQAFLKTHRRLRPHTRDSILCRATVKHAVIWVVILATVALSIYGLSNLDYPGLNSSSQLIFIIALSLAALTALTRKSPAFLGLGFIVVISIACGQAWPMIVIAVFCLSSTVLGRSILGNSVTESWSTYFLIGAGVLGTFTGLAAHLPINYAWLYSTLLLLPLFVGSPYTIDICQALYNHLRPQHSSRALTSNILDILIASFACVYVLIAFMPEIGHDALAVHLFVPSHMAQRHEWGFDAQTYVWALWPMLPDWIYSIVYMLAGETAARLINSTFILLIAWQVREMLMWAGGNTNHSRWAMLIFLSTPLTYAESSSLHIESIWTAFIMAGTLAILKVSSFTPDAKGRFAQLSLAGAMLGFSLAAKAVTLSILPILLFFLLLQYKTWAKKGLLRAIVIGSCCLILTGAFPYLFSWHLTGNPVFPFFNALFHSPLWPNTNFEPPAAFGKGVSWDTLYLMTFDSGRYIEGKVGAAGFQWLLLPAAAVALVLNGDKRALSILLICVGALVTTFLSMAYLRYVMPSFAMLSVILVLPFAVSKVFPKAACITAGTLLIILNTWFFQSATYYGQLVSSALLSTAGRDNYLVNRLPIRKAIDIVNTLNTGRHPVAVFAPPLMAGLSSDALYASWYNVKWKSEFESATTEAQLVRLLLDRRVDWLIIDQPKLSEEQFGLLLKVSTSIAQLKGVEVRKFNDAYRHSQERLLNGDLSSPEGWNLTSPASYDASHKILSVSVKTPATQMIKVTSGQSFKNSVSARCSTAPTPGRIQVNWLDENGAFISASIETFDCKMEWTTHEMTVVAPPNAHSAVVYASGHTETPLEFKTLSFRQ